MQFLVVAQGSRGNINPLAALAVECKRRGHQVTFITSEYYEPLTSRLGLELVPTTSRDEFLRFVSYPGFSQPRQSWILQMKAFLAEIEPVYKAIADRYQPGNTVVIAQLHAAGARMANEKLGVPLASVTLSPIWIPSLHQPIAGSEKLFRRIPLSVRKGLRDLTYGWLDSLVMKEMNSSREKLGLHPVRPLKDRWSLSPQLVIGLFPEWFSPYRPDWPSQVRLTDFAVSDDSSSEGLRPEVEEFLAVGSPPR